MKFIFSIVFLFLTIVSAHSYEYKNQSIHFSKCNSLIGESKEGFSFNYDLSIKLDLMLKEPIIRSQIKWNRIILDDNVCIIPYGSKEIIETQRSSESIHPFHMILLAKISSTHVSHNEDLFMRIDPGVVSSKIDEKSYNTPGSPSWDKLFFSIEGSLFGQDLDDDSKYLYVSRERAKNIFKDLKITKVLFAKVHYNLNELKLNFAKQEREKRKEKLGLIMDKVTSWIEGNVGPLPTRLKSVIDDSMNLETDKSITKLSTILNSILKKDLPPFLKPTEEDQENFKRLKKKALTRINWIDTISKDSNLNLSSILRENQKANEKVRNHLISLRAQLANQELKLPKKPELNYFELFKQFKNSFQDDFILENNMNFSNTVINRGLCHFTVYQETSNPIEKCNIEVDLNFNTGGSFLSKPYYNRRMYSAAKYSISDLRSTKEKCIRSGASSGYEEEKKTFFFFHRNNTLRKQSFSAIRKIYKLCRENASGIQLNF